MLFKGWRTIAFNLLMFLGTLGGILLNHLDVLQLEPKTALVWVVALKMLQELVNLILRFLTDTPVGKSL